MSKRRLEWAKEVEFATLICHQVGCVVERSQHAYEIATVKGEGVSLLIYPHKTTGTGNVSARARDNGSKDKKKARAVLTALKRGDGLPEDIKWKVATFNTFYCKTLP